MCEMLLIVRGKGIKSIEVLLQNGADPHLCNDVSTTNFCIEKTNFHVFAKSNFHVFDQILTAKPNAARRA